MASKDLEFNLVIYFMIYPLMKHQGHTSYGQERDTFKEYLDKNGPELTLKQNPERLAYFALMYVPNPQQHDSFRHLFEPAWTQNLR